MSDPSAAGMVIAIPAFVFTISWVLWLLFFCVVEWIAIDSKKTDNTFSGHVWYWFGVQNGHGWLNLFVRVVLLAFLVWLTGHLAFGLWST